MAIGESAVAAAPVTDGDFVAARNPATVIENGAAAANVGTFAAFMAGLLFHEHEFAGRVSNGWRAKIKRRGIVVVALEDGGDARIYRTGEITADHGKTINKPTVRIRLRCAPLRIVAIERTPENVACGRADILRRRALVDGRVHRAVGAPVDPILLVKAIGVSRGRAREGVVVFRQIHHHAETQLLQIIEAVRLRSLRLRFRKCGQKHARKNGDNRDYNQKFDERKRSATRSPGITGVRFHNGLYKNVGPRGTGNKFSLRKCYD